MRPPAWFCVTLTVFALADSVYVLRFAPDAGATETVVWAWIAVTILYTWHVRSRT